ncbi:MAG TPA: rhodanese-like domain-containing protein [Polyangiaceae bacterium]|nr:rhodanese-like domain-containing protein [Polyangiaceae bacterium]
MTAPRRVSPAEALELVERGGYAYLDVRSEPEFADAHPAGAYNVPLAHLAAGGLADNGDFVRVVEAVFAKNARLVVGCKSGGRSRRAAALLAQAGYGDVVDQRAGFDGVRDAFGALVEPGWGRAGLPVERGRPAGRAYGELRARAEAAAGQGGPGGQGGQGGQGD